MPAHLNFWYPVKNRGLRSWSTFVEDRVHFDFFWCHPASPQSLFSLPVHFSCLMMQPYGIGPMIPYSFTGKRVRRSLNLYIPSLRALPTHCQWVAYFYALKGNHKCALVWAATCPANRRTSFQAITWSLWTRSSTTGLRNAVTAVPHMIIHHCSIGPFSRHKHYTTMKETSYDPQRWLGSSKLPAYHTKMARALRLLSWPWAPYAELMRLDRPAGLAALGSFPVDSGTLEEV